MIRKNNLRKKYAIYSVFIGELFAAALIISSKTVLDGILSDLILILGIAAIVLVPVVIYIFYRMRGKDNEASSDELEQLVLQKAFALAGVVAVTLIPVLMLLCFIFPQASGLTAFAYSAIVGSTMKFAAFYYNKKY